jgi:diguanylate cyclase (GGDEF)-like protein
VNAVCELNHLAKAKFDEPGRQRALNRLEVVGSNSEAPFERIVDLVKTTLNAPICAVSLIDNERQWFKAFRGLSVDQTPRDIAFCDHAIRAEEPFIIEDAALDPRFANNPLVLCEPFIRAYLGIPLKMPDGYVVGTLCAIYQEPKAFSEHEIVILQSFANLVISELELRTIAFTDGLTNLLSRTAWRDRVAAEIDRAKRHGTSLSVLMIDLDHFKKINDTYGHDVGDIVLRKTAEIINSVLRNHDLVGRLGGEEFAVCVINAPEQAGLAVAERIRSQVESLAFPDHAGLSCSASIGVAVFAPGSDVHELLKRADLALYEAKSSGRNKVQLGHTSLLTG